MNNTHRISDPRPLNRLRERSEEDVFVCVRHGGGDDDEVDVAVERESYEYERTADST